MKGVVDNGGRSLLTVELKSSDHSATAEVEVWIDTGFTGDLVMPQAAINVLGLQQSGSIDAVLADGSQTELNTYSCVIEWFGAERNLEVIANDGDYPLPAGGTIRVVLIKEDHCWHAFYCTDLTASIQEIIEAFSDRATIEQDFHDH